MLVTYTAVAAFLYGLLLNLSFWPFTLGADTQLSFLPGASLVENLHRYVVFDVTTSLGWDTGRALTNGLLILLAGRPVLDALRRASRRASFDAPVTFVVERVPDVAEGVQLIGTQALGEARADHVVVREPRSAQLRVTGSRELGEEAAAVVGIDDACDEPLPLQPRDEM
jgi:hypothetical protein